MKKSFTRPEVKKVLENVSAVDIIKLRAAFAQQSYFTKT